MTNDPVLALDADLRALAAERSRLAAEHARREATGGCPRAIDAAFAAYSKKWHPAMRRLADTPATTPDGVLAKLRILAGSLVAGRETVYDEDILLLAIADLERLSWNPEPARGGLMAPPASPVAPRTTDRRKSGNRPSTAVQNY